MNDKSLNIKIPENLHRSLNEMAKKKNISVASLVRIILTEYLEKNSLNPASVFTDGFANALMLDSLKKNKK